MADPNVSIKGFLENLEPEGTPLERLLQSIKSASGSVHVVVSVLSGACGAKDFHENTLEPLLARFGLQGQYITHFTESAESVSQLTNDVFAQEALKEKPLLIIILSGDGGIIDLLTGLASASRQKSYTAPYVAALPFGTANALAHSTRIASDKTSGLAALVHGHARRLPCFQALFSPGSRLLADEGRRKDRLPERHAHLSHPESNLDKRSESDLYPELYGAVVCSWGFHAAIVADSDTAEFRKHGIDRFKMAANEALYPSDGKGPHEYIGDVYFKKGDKWTKVPRERHAYVLASMVSNLEQSFRISPASKPMDGSLRLVQFGPRSGDAIMQLMTKAYDGGKHVDDESVGYEDIDGLWIQMKEVGNDADDLERWRRVCIDGKIVAIEEGGWVYVQKNPDKACNASNLQVLFGGVLRADFGLTAFPRTSDFATSVPDEEHPPSIHESDRHPLGPLAPGPKEASTSLLNQETTDLKMDPKSSRVGPRKQGGRSQSTVGSYFGAITSSENRSVVTAVGLFAVGVAFLHSSWSEVLLPP